MRCVEHSGDALRVWCNNWVDMGTAVPYVEIMRNRENDLPGGVEQEGVETSEKGIRGPSWFWLRFTYKTTS